MPDESGNYEDAGHYPPLEEGFIVFVAYYAGGYKPEPILPAK